MSEDEQVIYEELRATLGYFYKKGLDMEVILVGYMAFLLRLLDSAYSPESVEDILQNLPEVYIKGRVK